MSKPNFPEYIDSTMRASFVSCPRKFHNEYLMNRRTTGSNIHLNAGKAFASAIETVRKAYWGAGVSADDALIAGTRTLIETYQEPERFEDEKKSLERMIGALEAYFANWGWDNDHFQPWKRKDGSPAVEFSFSIPLPGTRHPQTGGEIMYCGRFDWIAQHQETGLLYAADEKTTSALGATWPQQWRHRAQLTGYVWAGRQFGIDLQGALVRGIAILKTKYTHAECLALRTEPYIEKWLAQLKHDINRMVQCWEEGYFDYNFSDSCNSYSSPCTFTDACGSAREADYLRYNFEHLRWNPVLHQVEELDDEDNVVRIVE